MEVRQVIKILQTATAEDFDLASSQLEIAIEERREVMGNHAMRMEWEARDAVKQAKHRIGQESVDAMRRAIAGLRQATPDVFVVLREELTRKQATLSEWLGSDREALMEEASIALEAAKFQLQQATVAAARSAMQRLVTAATPEDLDHSKSELDRLMSQQAELMGTDFAQVEEEARRAVESVQARLQQQEELRAAAQREAEKNLHMVNSFTASVNHAEAEVHRTSANLARTLAQEEALPPEDAFQSTKLCEEAIASVKMSLEATQEQGMQLSSSLANAAVLAPKPAAILCGVGAADAQAQLRNLMARLQIAAANLGEAHEQAKVARERSSRKAAAIRREQEQKELFARFSNSDGLFNPESVHALAKAEYELDELTDVFLEKVRSALGAEAINYEKFARLRQMLAIERSEVKAIQKRLEEEERARREAEEVERRKQALADAEIAIMGHLKSVAEALPDAAATLAGVEVECSEFLVRGDSFNSTELLVAAAETETAMKRPVVALQVLREKFEAIEEFLDPELPKPLIAEVHDLKVKFERAAAREARMNLAISKAREKAKEAAAKEERLSKQREKIARLQAAYDDNGDDEDDDDDGEWQS